MAAYDETHFSGRGSVTGSKYLVEAAGKRLIDNIVSSLGNGVPQRIQELQIQHFYKADPAYGTGVAKRLGLNIESIIARAK